MHPAILIAFSFQTKCLIHRIVILLYLQLSSWQVIAGYEASPVAFPSFLALEADHPPSMPEVAVEFMYSFRRCSE